MSEHHVIAGAAGFIGSHLTDRLLSEGHRVTAIDNLCTGRLKNLEQAQASRAFSFVEHDIIQSVPDLGNVDFVWNLASPASPPDYLARPIETLRVGADGTRHLLDLAKRSGARFFQASTSEVYGDPDVSPQPESYWGRVNPIGPRSVYDESKRYAEALTMAYHRTHGVPVRIVRIFNTYGPRMRLDDGRVVPTFIGQALRGEPLTIFGSGTQTRSFCYVEDEVDGLVKLMRGPHTGPINVGNPREMTILEFARAVEKAMGRKLDIRHEPLPVDDPQQRRPDITKARTLLGWEPKIDLDEGLRRTVAYFRPLA